MPARVLWDDFQWILLDSNHGQSLVGSLISPHLCPHLFSKNIFLKYNWYTGKCIFKVYSLMRFDTSIHLWKHHCNQNNECIHHPQKSEYFSFTFAPLATQRPLPCITIPVTVPPPLFKLPFSKCYWFQVIIALFKIICWTMLEQG